MKTYQKGRALKLLALITLVLLSCSKNPAESTKLQVFVSIAPQKYFVEKIGKELVDVAVLVPPGASPHSYEPKPSQMTRLSRSKLFFAIGGDFEDAWLPRIHKNYSNLEMIKTDSGIRKQPVDHDCDSHADHKHEGLDPHIWLSPELVIQQAAVITDALSSTDPGNRQIYLHNNQSFQKEIKELQQKIRSLLANRPNKPFIVFHPSWGYFAREFNLTQVAIEVEGKEPSIKELKSVYDSAKEHNIRTIFVQPQFSKKITQTIASELKANVAIADPLAGSWAQNLLQFAEMLK